MRVVPLLLLTMLGACGGEQASPAAEASSRAEAIDELDRAADEAASIVERDALAEAPQLEESPPAVAATGTGGE